MNVLPSKPICHYFVIPPEKGRMKVKGKLLGEEVTRLVRAVDKGLQRSSV
jgi:hypothetical protein